MDRRVRPSRCPQCSTRADVRLRPDLPLRPLINPTVISSLFPFLIVAAAVLGPFIRASRLLFRRLTGHTSLTSHIRSAASEHVSSRCTSTGPVNLPSSGLHPPRFFFYPRRLSIFAVSLAFLYRISISHSLLLSVDTLSGSPLLNRHLEYRTRYVVRLLLRLRPNLLFSCSL